MHSGAGCVRLGAGGRVNWRLKISGGEVRVWDLQTLLPLHTLRQPAGDDVRSLVWDGREVWGAVGSQVVVWGRRPMACGRP